MPKFTIITKDLDIDQIKSVLLSLNLNIDSIVHNIYRNRYMIWVNGPDVDLEKYEWYIRTEKMQSKAFQII